MIYLEGHPVPQIVVGHQAGCQCRPCRARRADLSREAAMPCHRGEVSKRNVRRMAYRGVNVRKALDASCPRCSAIRVMIKEGSR